MKNCTPNQEIATKVVRYFIAMIGDSTNSQFSELLCEANL